MGVPSSPDDLRVARTRTAIQTAVRALVEETDFDRLTVQRIAERAQVNRATFYRHFANKHDVLVAVFEEAVHELADRLGHPRSDPGSLPDGQPPAAWVELFTHVRENRGLYRVALHDPDARWVRRRMREVFLEHSRERAARSGPLIAAPPMPTDLAGNMMWGALQGGMEWWCEHGENLEVEAIATWMQRFIAHGYFDAMGFPRERW